MFVEHFEKEEGVELTPDNKGTIEIMFLDCLSCLVWPWKESHEFTSEELYARELKSNALSQKKHPEN